VAAPGGGADRADIRPARVRHGRFGLLTMRARQGVVRATISANAIGLRGPFLTIRLRHAPLLARVTIVRRRDARRDHPLSR